MGTHGALNKRTTIWQKTLSSQYLCMKAFIFTLKLVCMGPMDEKSGITLTKDDPINWFTFLFQGISELSIQVLCWLITNPLCHVVWGCNKDKSLTAVLFSVYTYVFTRGQFWPSGIVVAWVCVCVCLSVCLSVCQSRVCPRDNSSPVRARITKFGAQMQNTLV